MQTIYFGTEYTALFKGQIPREVTCENCKEIYLYVLEREATGSGTSPYYLDDQGAQDRAASRAQTKLQRYLENDLSATGVPTSKFGRFSRLDADFGGINAHGRS